MLHADWLFFTSFDPFLCQWKRINKTDRPAVESVPVEFITARLSLRIVVVIIYADAAAVDSIK